MLMKKIAEKPHGSYGGLFVMQVVKKDASACFYGMFYLIMFTFVDMFHVSN